MDQIEIPQLGLSAFRQQMKDGAVIIDTRAYYNFIYGYIPGSVYVPLSSGFKELVGKLFPQKPLLIIFEADGEQERAESFDYLQDLKPVASLAGGFDTWKTEGLPVDMVVEIDAYEFSIDLPFDDRMYILDVREPALYEKEHVTGAYNMPLSQFGDLTALANFEESWNLYVYGERNEGAIAVSLLQRQGFYNARNISEGFSAIRKEEAVPLEKGKSEKSNGQK